MPIVKQYHKIIAYDIGNNVFGIFDLRTRTFEEAYHEFLEMCKLLVDGKFSYVRRLDFVCGDHVLFVFSDVRRIVNQYKSTIKIKSYD